MEQKLTKKEQEWNNFINEKHLTVDGLKSIGELTSRYGNPLIIIKVASIEARKTANTNVSIPVERVIDVELHFSESIIIRGISKSMALKMDANGIHTEKTRMPGYRPENPPVATVKELRDYAKAIQGQEQEV